MSSKYGACFSIIFFAVLSLHFNFIDNFFKQIDPSIYKWNIDGWPRLIR